MMINSGETEKIRNFARFDFLDLCLLGETGTGKTQTARLIHELSPRKEKPFVAINCAELASSIIEAELFGYEKGAFTGAISTKIGIFEMAAGGTLFLDEIGDLSSELQAKLLKAVEEKTIKRVGGSRLRQIDVRIICATHRNLDVLREDLRYRIAAHVIYLKPLRECKSEIVSLARLFVTQFSYRSKCVVNASDETLKLLETARWQGNIRELRSFIEKTCLDALLNSKNAEAEENTVELTKELILAKLSVASVKPPVSEYLATLAPGEKMAQYLQRIETYLLRNALDNHNNNQTRAAKYLGISRTGLIKKMKRIGH